MSVPAASVTAGMFISFFTAFFYLGLMAFEWSFVVTFDCCQCEDWDLVEVKRILGF